MQLHSTLPLNNMNEQIEKGNAVSKVVRYEYTWTIEPITFETSCNCCEFETGGTSWFLNCCTLQDDQCRNCFGPYLQLLTEPSKDAIISVREESVGRKVHLARGSYTMESNRKLHLQVLKEDGSRSWNSSKRRTIVVEIWLSENTNSNNSI